MEELNLGIVTKESLLEELLDDVQRFKKEGMVYHQTIAELALVVAKQVEDVSLFFSNPQTKKCVESILSTSYEKNIEDVSKILNLIFISEYSKYQMDN